MKLKLNFKFRISRKLVVYLIALAMVLIFSYFSYFMYQNFWQVLTFSQEIVALRPEVVSEKLNQAEFERIIVSINKKTGAAASIPTTTPNLFIVAPTGGTAPRINF